MPPGFSWKKEALIWLIVLAPIIYILLVWEQLPDRVPTHWNYRGEIDNYGSPLLLPGINAVTYVILLFLPLFDPRKRNYEFFAGSYYKIRLFIALFLSGIAILSILIGQGAEVDMIRTVVVGVFLLIALLGNYLKTVKPNWFVGIRTPWTLESEEVWRKTHRLAGWLWFFGGLLGATLALVLGTASMGSLLLVVLGTLVIVPVAYSYWLYRNLGRFSTE